MITEIGEKLGLPLDSKPMTEKNGLPIYLAYRSIYSVSFNTIGFVVVELPEEEPFNVRRLRSQLTEYQAFFGVDVAFALQGVTRHQREALIGNGIPFIAGSDQIYLPFLGLLLQNRFKTKKLVRFKTVAPSTQMLFLLLLYEADGKRFTKSEAAEALGLTNMSITRAAEQLKEAGLLNEEKLGTAVWISRTESGNVYFKEAEEYLENPVQQRYFVKPDEILKQFPDAGETALSRISMLGEPPVRVKACQKALIREMNLTVVDPLLEPDRNYIELQAWKYDPAPFAVNGCVDPVSLYCSLRKVKDERVQGEIREYLEAYQWQ